MCGRRLRPHRFTERRWHLMRPMRTAHRLLLESMPRPQQSELWQRLRAARELARKSYADVAGAVGSTIPRVASWESADVRTRLRPGSHDVLRVAKLCGLPPFYLMDD